VNVGFMRAQRKVASTRRWRVKARRADGVRERTKPPPPIVKSQKELKKLDKKRCLICKVDFPRDEMFFSSRKGKSRILRSACRKCEKYLMKYTFRIFLSRKYYGIRRRCSGKDRNHVSCVGKPFPSKQDFFTKYFGDKDVRKLWEVWKQSGYVRALAPSVDRRDASKGYEFGNIQWLTWQEHIGKTKMENQEKAKRKFYEKG